VRILFAAAEASPYAKVGGLGDVAAALPKALARLGHDVRLLLPRSRGVLADMRQVAWEEELAYGDGVALVRALAGTLPGSDPPVAVHLLDAPPFAQAEIYGGDDEGDRFALFANAVLFDAITEAATTPDVVHVHDWHTALAPVLLRARHAGDLRFAALRTVLTIHNLAYQGIQGPEFAERHGLERPPARGDTAVDAVNVLGRGIAHADRVTTVSAAYAREILEPLAGHGLDALLRERGVAGIANGIDTDVFDPATDPALAVPFDAARLGARRATRAALATELGLSGVDAPLVGVVSRLVAQKGLDLLLEVAPLLLDRGAQLVVLGTGEPWLEDGFRALAAARPDAAAAVIGFDADLAQRIYGGCDIFAMPSRFEPGGLGQLIAMRYGAVPLVRRTGGLADTVVPYAPGQGTGFLFDDVDPAALYRAVDEALAVHRDAAEWEALQRRALAVDSSWGSAARAYAALYAATAAG
jgi:starch synthase